MKRKYLISCILVFSVLIILTPCIKANAAPKDEIQDYIEAYQHKSGVKNVSVVVYQ